MAAMKVCMDRVILMTYLLLLDICTPSICTANMKVEQKSLAMSATEVLHRAQLSVTMTTPPSAKTAIVADAIEVHLQMGAWILGNTRRCWTITLT